MAPPCHTFTKARRSDQFGKVRIMRTKEAPEGKLYDQAAQDANLLANRCAALATEQGKNNRYFSIENPKKSFIWELKLLKRAEKLEGVSIVHIDQCAYGSPHKKPTTILTNAPWILD